MKGLIGDCERTRKTRWKIIVRREGFGATVSPHDDPRLAATKQPEEAMPRVIRIAALSVLSLSFAAPPVAVPTVALAKPLDGEPTPAACRPLGFEL
ncbi:hypothetical protein, partial [Brevundimonas sp.]|uniref:hypothetical protein n=1 Tax=Brevundimonas sp. TaxID=1871086 RepID=UPI0028A8A757